jgi:hypothetical protein
MNNPTCILSFEIVQRFLRRRSETRFGHLAFLNTEPQFVVCGTVPKIGLEAGTVLIQSKSVAEVADIVVGPGERKNSGN